MNTWKERLKDHRDSNHVEREIAPGFTVRFYPNRLAVLDRARELSKPVAEALTTLFADTRNDFIQTNKEMREGDSVMTEQEILPPSIDLIEKRQGDRAEALEGLLSVVTDERNKYLLAELLMDSMRDEFPYSRDRSPADIKEFLTGDEAGEGAPDLPLLINMVGGWIQANTAVFGDAGKSLLASVTRRVQELDPDESDSARTDQSSGDSSKTPSSSQSEPDGESSTSSDSTSSSSAA